MNRKEVVISHVPENHYISAADLARLLGHKGFRSFRIQSVKGYLESGRKSGQLKSKTSNGEDVYTRLPRPALVKQTQSQSPTPAPEQEPEPTPVRKGTPQSGARDYALSALGNKPVTSVQISQSSNGRFTPTNIACALYSLEKQGLAEKHKAQKGSNCVYAYTKATIAKAAEPAPTADESVSDRILALQIKMLEVSDMMAELSQELETISEDVERKLKLVDELETFLEKRNVV